MVEVIAIDGPAGSGKSSVSKEVARRLGFGYLDTGAAYRALAWAKANGVVADIHEAALADFDYQIALDPDNFWVKVGQVEVTDAIREPEVALAVSAVAAVPDVRSFMKALTRRLVADSGLRGVVVEGRDITTVVFPEAKNRLLLTASEEVRLRRRAGDLGSSDVASVSGQVLSRDAQDSKVVDFMTPAPGVTLIDSTNLDFEQTVSAVLEALN